MWACLLLYLLRALGHGFVACFCSRSLPLSKENAATLNSVPNAKPIATLIFDTLGTGLRQILNFEVLERVLKRNGIETYTNVSVSGEDDTEGHIKVFSDFGLMIASHSSQLKNNIFSPKYVQTFSCHSPSPSHYLSYQEHLSKRVSLLSSYPLLSTRDFRWI